MERKIVFGKHPVQTLLDERIAIEKIFMLQSAKGPFEIAIRSYCNENAIPLVKTKNESLNKLASGKNHQGIIAITSAVAFSALDDVIPHLYENGKVPLLLILDHITDVRNLGAIARSAEIFGVHAIVVPKKGSASINEDALKTSAGAILKIPICRFSNLEEAVELVKSNGIRVVAADQTATTLVHDTDMKQPIALVMGSESHGVQKSVLRMCDDTIGIPQVGKTDSLNVSVAAGVILYEIQRQRV